MSRIAPLMVFMIGHRIGRVIRKIVRWIRPKPPEPCPNDY